MANTHTTLTSLFSDIADSIRAKKGTSAEIVADNFPSEIDSLTTKGIMQQDVNQLISNIRTSGTMPLKNVYWERSQDTLEIRFYTTGATGNDYKILSQFDCIAGHKYAVRAKGFNGGNNNTYHIRITNLAKDFFDSNFIVVQFNVSTTIYLNFYFYTNAVFDTTFRNEVIDLTQMFGAGNEPSEETCNKIFADYQPYNTGTITNKDIDDITNDLIKLPDGIGIVDLGTLDWIFHSASGVYTEFFDTTSIADIELGDGNKYSQMLCYPYEVINSGAIAKIERQKYMEIAVANSVNRVIITNNNYHNATDFKNAMQGVLLFYKKA